MKDIIHNQKLIDENNHDQALSITCSNRDCEYQLVKLGNITTQPIQVLTYNYSLEQAYAWIADPTYKKYWSMGTYMQVPNAPPNPGTGYPFSAYFGSLIGATSILQPVISWGQQGRRQWEMYPEFVWTDKNIVQMGTPVKVNVGDWINGVMYTWTPHWWMVWTQDTNTNNYSSIYAYDGEAIGVASDQLEVYNIDNCGQLPSAATIDNGFSDASNPTWHPQVLYPGFCGLAVQIYPNTPHLADTRVVLKTGN